MGFGFPSVFISGFCPPRPGEPYALYSQANHPTYRSYAAALSNIWSSLFLALLVPYFGWLLQICASPREHTVGLEQPRQPSKAPNGLVAAVLHTQKRSGNVGLLGTIAFSMKCSNEHFMQTGVNSRVNPTSICVLGNTYNFLPRQSGP